MTHIDFLMYIISILKQNNIEYALFCGTLLGCMREGDFLSCDTKDTDIIIDGKHQKKVIKLLECTIKNKTIKWWRKWRKEVSIESLDSLFKVDIFFVDFEQDKMYLYSYQKNLRTLIYDIEFRIIFNKDDIFHSINHIFLNNTIKIPRNWEIVLATHYGDWRIPNPTFNSEYPPNRDLNYKGDKNV